MSDLTDPIVGDGTVPFDDLCPHHEVGPGGEACPPYCHWYCDRTQTHLEERIATLEAEKAAVRKEIASQFGPRVAAAIFDDAQRRL